MSGIRKNPYQDKDIIAGILKGGIPKEKALKIIYSSHLGYIHKGVNTYRLTENNAIDAYNDAVLGLMQQVMKGSFDGKARLSTYLFKIFHFKCVDKIKKKQTNEHVIWEDAFPQLQDASKDFLRRIISTEEWEHTKGLLKQLGEKCRQMMLLAAQGYRPAEIAVEMGLKNAQTAKTRKYKCAERFRELLKKRSLNIN